MRRLVIEALVVGLALAAALGAVRWALPSTCSSVGAAAATGLVVGAAFHVVFELAGLNAAYCKTGHACVVTSVTSP